MGPSLFEEIKSTPGVASGNVLKQGARQPHIITLVELRSLCETREVSMVPSNERLVTWFEASDVHPRLRSGPHYRPLLPSAIFGRESNVVAWGV